jgi:hypothetical protein
MMKGHKVASSWLAGAGPYPACERARRFTYMVGTPWLLGTPGQRQKPETHAIYVVPGFFSEPPVGIEPTTFSLRVRRSAD